MASPEAEGAQRECFYTLEKIRRLCLNLLETETRLSE